MRFSISKIRVAAILLLMPALGALAPGCSSLAYQPSHLVFADPHRAHVDFQSVYFTARDGTRLHGWYFPVTPGWKGPAKGTFIQFHGNAQNMTSHFISLYWVTLAGYNFFTFDYRGYGESQGKPSQKGVNEDALAAVKYVVDHGGHGSAKKDLVLYGQSLGGAVLLRAFRDIKKDPAVASRVRLVVIESSFYSYQAIGRALLAKNWFTWLLQPLAYVLVSDAYSPEDDIAEISPTPLLVIHGDHDGVIPFSFGQKIYQMAKPPKTFWRVPGGRHIEAMFYDKGAYREKLIDFLEALPGG